MFKERNKEGQITGTPDEVKLNRQIYWKTTYLCAHTQFECPRKTESLLTTTRNKSTKDII